MSIKRQNSKHTPSHALTPDWPMIHWTESGESRSARWRSEAGVAPPQRMQIVDDTLTADAAYRLAGEGTAFLWGGDFQNAGQLLKAMPRPLDQKPQKPLKT